MTELTSGQSFSELELRNTCPGLHNSWIAIKVHAITLKIAHIRWMASRNELSQVYCNCWIGWPVWFCMKCTIASQVSCIQFGNFVMLLPANLCNVSQPILVFRRIIYSVRIKSIRKTGYLLAALQMVLIMAKMDLHWLMNFDLWSSERNNISVHVSGERTRV